MEICQDFQYFLPLPDWGNPDPYLGCRDKSDKVKPFDRSNKTHPCIGNKYTYYDYWKEQVTIEVDWKWFACTQTRKCIRQQSRCDSFPHPDCIYEKDGLMIAEDEEYCSIGELFHYMETFSLNVFDSTSLKLFHSFVVLVQNYKLVMFTQIKFILELKPYLSNLHLMITTENN